MGSPQRVSNFLMVLHLDRFRAWIFLLCLPLLSLINCKPKMIHILDVLFLDILHLMTSCVAFVIDSWCLKLAAKEKRSGGLKDSNGFVNYKSSFGQWLSRDSPKLSWTIIDCLLHFTDVNVGTITATCRKLCNHWRHIFKAVACSLIRVWRAKFVACIASSGCINVELYCFVTIVDLIYWIPVALVITRLFIVAMEKLLAFETLFQHFFFASQW